MSKVLRFFQKDLVFTIALALAVVSMFVVPPNPSYLGYIDFSVIGTLFCLMCVVAGFRECGLLDWLSGRVLGMASHARTVSLLFVILCFFCSMLLTNDVTLMAFVPLTLVVLRSSSPLRIAWVVSLETTAANLGSMLTPIGNPQNLYLYSHYQMQPAAFFRTVAPVCVVSFFLLVGCVFLSVRGKPLAPPQSAAPLDKKRLALHLILFAFCLLTVLRVLDYRVSVAVVLLALLFLDRTILPMVDYRLLGTFAAFFILVGNLGAIDAVRDFLASVMEGREMVVSALVSQVTSNVPASILLSGFTDDGRALLLGTNIGGLGTLVASLASLISYRLYLKGEKARPGMYLGLFTALNVTLLVLLLLFAQNVLL
jgi:Na+/H+ antiporter NhaD/arsenite permease-like protein